MKMRHGIRSPSRYLRDAAAGASTSMVRAALPSLSVSAANSETPHCLGPVPEITFIYAGRCDCSFVIHVD